MLTKIITTKIGKGSNVKRRLQSAFQIPQTLEDCTKLAGSEVGVVQAFKTAYVIAGQQFLRTKMGLEGADKMQDVAILEAFKKWAYRPGSKGDPVKRNAKAKSLFAGLSNEEREEIIRLHNAGQLEGKTIVEAMATPKAKAQKSKKIAK